MFFLMRPYLKAFGGHFYKNNVQGVSEAQHRECLRRVWPPISLEIFEKEALFEGIWWTICTLGLLFKIVQRVSEGDVAPHKFINF